MKKTIAALTASILITGSFIPSAFASTYSVKKGDTISKIAQNHATTTAKIKDLNKLKSDSLKIGQLLQVPDKAPASEAKAPLTYVIVKGDTLDKVSKKFKISSTDLRKWNSLNNDTIKLGQKLIVSQPAAAPPVKPAPVHQAPAKTLAYTVKAGDSLWKISAAFKVTVADLTAANKLTKESISTGQVLAIPQANSTGAAAPAPKPAVQDPAVNVNALLNKAKKYIGVPYVYGGTTPSGFDCSGFVYYVYNQAGYKIQRQSSASYFSTGKPVSVPAPGDLVFFSGTTGGKEISHMGIYMGDGQFIHANSDKGIEITSVNVSYYKNRLLGYKRLF
ncbi:LysM peptidoglycan-binding domain-containing protein [Peribacillus kribbensis]|uniref:C40 family peptidase n=1 Tax=Peribacillus kribbensis TaxID=356658 RepID=UPI0004234A4D|nr:C40 family peptidase [Peribacillus kribbensis]